MSKTTTTDFSKVLEDAEKQVAGIKNEKLKEIAFGKLVSHLLDGNISDDEDVSPKKQKVKKTSRTTSRQAKNKTDGPLAWLRDLVADGFFKKPKSSSNIREELKTQDHHLEATDLTAPLRILCKDKLLRRKKMTPEEGVKAVLHWVNW